MKIFATKSITFEAGHFLEGYAGLCAFVHGHSYTLEVTVTRDLHVEGQERGMVQDFTVLKSEILKPIVDELDHSLLVENRLDATVPEGSEISPLGRQVVLGFRPTTECLAMWLFGLIKERADAFGVTVVRVRLKETATGWVDVEA